VTVTAPPRPPVTEDRPDQEALAALIEEARRRARRRRRRNGAAALLVVGAGVAAFVGLANRGGGGARTVAPARIRGEQRRIEGGGARTGGVLVTMRGDVIAARTLHAVGGPVHYREAGRFRVAWRIPAGALTGDRSFQSSSAVVSGTTSAIFDDAPAKSCRGTLTVRRQPFLLRVVHGRYDGYLAAAPIGFDSSPSPIATATSATCSRGLLAGRWRTTLPGSRGHAPYGAADKRRTHDWWVYNHPGGSFYGKNFTPTPKGGDSEGWIQGWGPAGSFRWLAVFRVRPLAAAGQMPSYRRVLQADYTPIPGLFLRAVEPCTTNQFAACRRIDGTVLKAVERLTTALGRIRAPRTLARGDHELRRGLASLAAALELRIKLAHQDTIGPFINADGDIITALNIMDRATADLNREDPSLHLRPV
jgi:hypothetical protein